MNTQDVDLSYIQEAFPDYEITQEPYSIGDGRYENRVAVSVHSGELRITKVFSRQTLVEAYSNNDQKDFIVGVFQDRLS